ncbi:serine/threonine-protein kinase [Microlunatus ginsengisoli]|uniref:non-specific serine/threonine protein kinase n=1 Tax=Microlunatus ginsengisoli TaxID=363863 RepID=A0ABP7AY71_9ACTN
MATPDVLIGNRYRLVRTLGSGGMSVVWEARDELLDRRVAVKELRLQPGLSAEEARTVAERAMREARINARLQHPHAVTIFDVVEHDGRPCLVMELMSSRTLADVVRQSGSHALESSYVARVGSQVAAALAAAHRLGIVHRDIKPSNILISADGRACISDFGISRAIGDTTLTMTGMISGTPAYLAPEVARGSEATAASDVFSLGATLYSVLEGTPPFGTDGNAIALLHKVAEGDVPTPRRAGDLTPLLGRMLARQPPARPEMDQVATLLTELGSTDADHLSEGGTGVSTVAIEPPTGASRGVGVGTALGAGSGAATDLGAGSTVPLSSATTLPSAGRAPATPAESVPTAAAPSAGDPPGPPNRTTRRGRITAAVAAVTLIAAVAVVGVLWQHPLTPGPGPYASSQPGASQAQTHKPASKKSTTQATQDAGSGETTVTDEQTTSNAQDKSPKSNEPTKAPAPTGTSEKPGPPKPPKPTKPAKPTKPTDSGPGRGNGNGNGHNESRG